MWQDPSPKFVATVSDFTGRTQDPLQDIKFQLKCRQRGPRQSSQCYCRYCCCCCCCFFFLLLIAVFLAGQPVSVSVASPVTYFLPAALVTVAGFLCCLLIAFLTLHASASTHNSHARRLPAPPLHPLKIWQEMQQKHHQHSLLHLLLLLLLLPPSVFCFSLIELQMPQSC